MTLASDQSVPVGRSRGLRQRLDYLCRLLGTGLAFSTFGLGGLVAAVTVFPALHLFIRDRARRREIAKKTIFNLFRGFVLLLSITNVARAEVRHGERLKQAAGRIVIANHPTLLDVVMLMSLMPRMQCVVKGQLWRNPFLMGVVRAAGYIRNDLEPEAFIDECRHALDRGESLIIFPEGTRTRPGADLNPLQRGFANIALAANADLLPVVIKCNHVTLKKGTPWYDIPPSQIVFDIEIGNAVPLEAVVGQDKARAKQARAISAHVREYFLSGLGHDGIRTGN